VKFPRRDQRGAAMVEALFIGVLLIVPLIWTFGVLAELHRTALAATSAVREAGLDAARAGDMLVAANAVEAAVERAFIDHGLDPTQVKLRWTADRRLERGSRVEVVVAYPVSVVRAPLLGSVSGPSIWVRARHVARVDLYRSRS
jgi:Flp pilus assembly protein TadG